MRAIDRDIQLTNDNPAKHVKVSLTPGAQPGDIDAIVDVSDDAPVRYLLGYNNTGSPITGRHRVSVGVQHANLFGRDHVGTLQYQTSPENPARVRIASRRGSSRSSPQISRASACGSANGTSTPCPSASSSSACQYGVETIASACDADPELDRRVLGIHLEGPWISAEDGYRGAHPREHVRDCDWAEFEALHHD